MGVVGRLRAFVERASIEQLPPDIYASLIDSLYAPFVSFALGAAVPPIAGGIAAWRTGNIWLTVLSLGAALVAGVRVLILLEYRKRSPAVGVDAAVLRRWERLYELGAAIYAACIGGMCFVVFASTEDAVSQLVLNATAFAYCAGGTARNAGRPRVAAVQLSFILLPLAIGSTVRDGAAYWAISAITLVYFVAALEIVQHLGITHLRLLLITREKGELARSLAEQNFRFDTALNNMTHGLCMFDEQHRLRVWNKRFCEIYRIPPEALSAGISVKELVELSAARGNDPARSVAAIVADYAGRLARNEATHYKRTLPTGRIIAVSHQPMAGGGAVAIFEDITEREEAEARASFLATHDDLTGLPNRAVFGRAVNEAVKLGRRQAKEFAVMFLDLDRFKIINDTLGHAAGDLLLVEIARRLRRCLRESDLVSRVGGDEFIVLLRETSDAQQVATMARKILAAIVKPLTLHGQECRVTASIGISLFPSDAQDEESLTKNADAAMYAAKEDGRNNFLFHSREIKTQSIERLMLETSLRRALKRNELVLYYQPKRDLSRGGISGVEALLRWNHPDLGLLLPNRFIPLAEETGLIVPIGRWVLQTACLQNMAWQRQGLPPIRVAVNLSPRQFADPNLLGDIRTALEKSGLPPQLLELEITESMVMQNMERTMRVLEAIKRLGITLSIDDFGTGYSSMSLVKKLPIDALKIDRSFVREIASDADDKAIAEAIIALGRALDLTVVAEGVETAEQEAVLRAHNCDEIQGFLISKPIPADEFAAFVADHTLAELKAVTAAAASANKAMPTGTRA